MIYWHCPVCEATALLPAKTIEASIKGLNQHERIFKHEAKRAWHRVRMGKYLLLDSDGSKLGSVNFADESWFAAVNAEVIGTRANYGPFMLKRDAQKEVERLVERMVRVVMA